jgi:hypothetical protein
LLYTAQSTSSASATEANIREFSNKLTGRTIDNRPFELPRDNSRIVGYTEAIHFDGLSSSVT